MGKLLPRKKKDIKSDQETIGLLSLDDLVHGNRGKCLVQYLRLVDKLYMRKVPEECKVCGCKKISGIYVLGARDGILFWQCPKCESGYLRYTERTTERYLQKATKVWTNTNDWYDFPDEAEVQ